MLFSFISSTKKQLLCNAIQITITKHYSIIFNPIVTIGFPANAGQTFIAKMKKTSWNKKN